MSRQQVKTNIEDVSWIYLDDKTGRGLNFSGESVMESSTADKDIADLGHGCSLILSARQHAIRTPAGVVEHAQLAANEEDADRISRITSMRSAILLTTTSSTAERC